MLVQKMQLRWLKMISITIDNKTILVNSDETVLDGAKKLGIEIPTLCHINKSKPFTSCMVCVVKDNKTGRLIPSCSIKATEGMDISTNTEEVFNARKAALELLLSEHNGDCEAPCQRICPAHLDIPEMLRLIGKKRLG